MKKIRRVFSGLMMLVISMNFVAVSGHANIASESKVRIAVVGLGTPSNNEPSVRQYLGESLTNELVQANRFIVIDRMRTEEVMEEQIKGQLGGVDAATAARMAGILGVQFLVMITPMELKEERGTCVRAIWGIEFCSTVAKVAINIQSINAETAEIAFSKRIEASHAAAGVSIKREKIDGGMKSSAMNKAVDKAMKKAADSIAEQLANIEVREVTGLRPAIAGSAASSTSCSVPSNVKSKRIMVVIPETLQKKVTSHPSGETEIIRQLVQKGLNVVDQGQINAIRNREIVLTAFNNEQAAVNLALEFGANIIVIGDLVGESLGRNGNAASTRVRLEAKAIQTDNARILYAGGKTTSGIDLTESLAASSAFQKVGSEWAAEFLSRLCTTPESIAPPVVSPAYSTVEVLMSNTDFTQMRLLSEEISRISGVRKVTKSLTGNIARLLVDFDGSVDTLGEAIEKAQLGGEKLSIISFEAGKIVVGIGQLAQAKPKSSKKK